MAPLNQLITTFIFVLALSRIKLSTCQVLKGIVSCTDCGSHNDLSGIMVQVKCNGVKKMAMATAKDAGGSFQVDLPSETSKTQTPLNCQAKIFGGPTQLYATKLNMVSDIVKAHDHSDSDSSYTISTPLVVYTSCPESLKNEAKCGGSKKEIGGSKTIDLPLPREWGLAPSSYYFPFFPIIGIP